jgi:hypothetical protein
MRRKIMQCVLDPSFLTRGCCDDTRGLERRCLQQRFSGLQSILSRSLAANCVAAEDFQKWSTRPVNSSRPLSRELASKNACGAFFKGRGHPRRWGMFTRGLARKNRCENRIVVGCNACRRPRLSPRSPRSCLPEERGVGSSSPPSLGLSGLRSPRSSRCPPTLRTGLGSGSRLIGRGSCRERYSLPADGASSSPSESRTSSAWLFLSQELSALGTPSRGFPIRDGYLTGAGNGTGPSAGKRHLF